MGKLHKQPAFFVLIMVLALAMVGLVLTRGSGQPSVIANKMQQAPDRQTLVDQRPLQMARAVAVFAATPNESDLAQQALRLADHEVDLTFTSALRQASQHPEPLSQEARQLDASVKKIQAVVAGEQTNVVKLTKAVKKASETEKDDLNQQLQLAQAQLALEQYELDDAKEDLARSGGDTRSKIQRMLDEHEASQHEEGNKTSAQPAGAGTATKAEVPTTGSLLAEIQTWNSIRVARNQVRQAQQHATAAAAGLAGSHDALERQIRTEQSQSQPLATASPQALSKQAAAARIAAL